MPALLAPPPALVLRPARPADALSLSVLAMQVYLDTYARQGIRDAIARDVLRSFPEPAFAAAIADGRTRLQVAEREGHLIGFAQLTLGARHELVDSDAACELLRLYVQEPFTGLRVGSRLLAEAERLAREAGGRVVWLTPWSGNARALAFYQRCGYQDHGQTFYLVEDERHENRVYAKALV